MQKLKKKKKKKASKQASKGYANSDSKRKAAQSGVLVWFDRRDKYARTHKHKINYRCHRYNTHARTHAHTHIYIIQSLTCINTLVSESKRKNTYFSKQHLLIAQHTSYLYTHLHPQQPIHPHPRQRESRERECVCYRV
jgi:hypothetical protein